MLYNIYSCCTVCYIDIIDLLRDTFFGGQSLWHLTSYRFQTGGVVGSITWSSGLTNMGSMDRNGRFSEMLAACHDVGNAMGNCLKVSTEGPKKRSLVVTLMDFFRWLAAIIVCQKTTSICKSGLNDCFMFPVEDWMFPLLFEITGVYLDVFFFFGGGALSNVWVLWWFVQIRWNTFYYWWLLDYLLEFWHFPQ